MLKKRARFWLAATIIFSLLALTLACGGKKDETGGGGETGGTETAGGAKWTAKGDEGTITGKINLNGEPPAPSKIDMNADANCAQKNPDAKTETVVAKDGKLQNVFVYIKDG